MNVAYKLFANCIYLISHIILQIVNYILISSCLSTFIFQPLSLFSHLHMHYRHYYYQRVFSAALPSFLPSPLPSVIFSPSSAISFSSLPPVYFSFSINFGENSTNSSTNSISFSVSWFFFSLLMALTTTSTPWFLVHLRHQQQNPPFLPPYLLSWLYTLSPPKPSSLPSSITSSRLNFICHFQKLYKNVQCNIIFVVFYFIWKYRMKIWC